MNARTLATASVFLLGLALTLPVASAGCATDLAQSLTPDPSAAPPSPTALDDAAVFLNFAAGGANAIITGFATAESSAFAGYLDQASGIGRSTPSDPFSTLATVAIGTSGFSAGTIENAGAAAASTLQNGDATVGAAETFGAAAGEGLGTDVMATQESVASFFECGV